MKVIHKMRHWLNPNGHDDTGAISSYAILAAKKKKKGKSFPYLDMSLTIRDCSRQMSLNFDVYPPRNKEKTLKIIKQRRKKLSILRKHINKLEDTMIKYEVMIEDFELVEEGKDEKKVS